MFAGRIISFWCTMASWSDGTIQPPAADAIPLAAAITVASPAAAGPAAAGPIIGARNAKMPENSAIARSRADRRGYARRNLMPEHAKRRGAAWGNRGYAEIAAIELQREKFVVDSGERHRVPGSADRPGRLEDVAPGGSIDLNGHLLAVVGR